jgi:uncharacterized protein
LVTGTAVLCFFGEIRDFLGPDNREAGVAYPVDRRAAIKDVVEALGIPHTEIGKILVDGREVDFCHLLRPGKTVQVLSHDLPIRVDRAKLLRPRPYPGPRFIVDVNVGKLARLLRILGIDAAYDHEWTDEMIAALGHKEMRVVLSRDKDLLKRSLVEHGRLIRSTRPMEQLAEVLRNFDLKGSFDLFSRCLRCNVALQHVSKEAVLHRLEPKTRQYYHRFQFCPCCERIYWRGSHHERMLEEMKELGIGL